MVCFWSECGVGDDAGFSFRRDHRTRYTLSAMERMSLVAADAVVYPSLALRHMYETALGVRSQAVALGSPPMSAVLSPLCHQGGSGSGGCGGDRGEAGGRGGVTGRQIVWDAGSQRDILVWGKVVSAKGVPFMVQGLMDLFKRDRRPHVHFIGLDWQGTVERVTAGIPPNLRHRFHFDGPQPRRQLPELVRLFRVGLFASNFESFCFAAHELHALRLPLVVSTMRAFEVCRGPDVTGLSLCRG